MNRNTAAALLLLVGFLPATGLRADWIDDASVNHIASYTRSSTTPTFVQGAMAMADGAYAVSITGTAYQAWYYPGQRFTSSNAGFRARMWVQGVDTPEAAEERTHYFLTWGIQTNEAAYHDPANRYAVGYAVRYNGRQNYTYQGGNAVSIRQKKPGNLGSGLYREPNVGTLVTALASVSVGVVNPGIYYRLEWKVDQVNGTNRLVAALYQGSSPEFTDTLIPRGACTNTVTGGNVLTSGYLGFGVYRESTAAAGPVTRIQRLEFVQVPVRPAGTVVLLR